MITIFVLGFFCATSYASDCSELTMYGEELCEIDTNCTWEEDTCTEYCPTLDETECTTDESCTWEEEICVKLTIPEEPIETNIEPVKKQIVEINSAEEGWQPSKLQTYATKFLIRGKEALTWSLNIEDAGFHNPAIQTSYNKVLTIVNSLFILGLLAIAAMWMLSIVIPRRYLKQVILYFAAAVIFVNFALPITRLLIDSTNLLQKTLLTQQGETIVIADIVETPEYKDAISYQNNNMVITKDATKDITIALTDDTEAEEVMIGTIETEEEQEIIGSISSGDDEIDETEEIELQISAIARKIMFKKNQPVMITGVSEFHPETEQSIFSFIMIILTGLAYFIMALIFVLRIIILWALLILSPILFLLGIFKTTRGWFYNWLTIYGRWLLIGPLIALGLAVIINIWQLSEGPPITNPYIGETFANNMTNIGFRLPGSNMLNTLSSTGEMMEYLVFLLMLYIPIFFAFGLTRQKILRGTVATVTERWKDRKPIPVMSNEGIIKERTTEKTESKTGTLGMLKDAFTGQIAKMTKTAMPNEMREVGMRKSPAIPSAANFLPEQLALTGIHDMMGLLGVKKESRKSRDITIEKLANPEMLIDPKESVKHSAVRNEIEKRANYGDPEAVILMNQIKEKETKDGTPASPTISPTTGTPISSTTGTPISSTISPQSAPRSGPIIEKEIREKETVVEKPIEKSKDVETRFITSQDEDNKSKETEEPEEGTEEAGEETETKEKSDETSDETDQSKKEDNEEKLTDEQNQNK